MADLTFDVMKRFGSVRQLLVSIIDIRGSGSSCELESCPGRFPFSVSIELPPGNHFVHSCTLDS